MSHTDPRTTTHWAGLVFLTSDFRGGSLRVYLCYCDALNFLSPSHYITHTEHTNYRTLYVNWKMKNARLMKTWHTLVTTYSKKIQLEC